MQRRESYLYVGMDLHKKTHTAVLVNCWNEKHETLVIENKPVLYNSFDVMFEYERSTIGIRIKVGNEYIGLSRLSKAPIYRGFES